MTCFNCQIWLDAETYILLLLNFLVLRKNLKQELETYCVKECRFVEVNARAPYARLKDKKESSGGNPQFV